MLIHCRAPLPPDSCLFDKYHGKKASDYDVPHATSVCDDQFTHVVGYLSLKDGMSVIMVVWTSYNPSDNSYLSLKQPSVASATRTVLLWWISSYIMSEHICAFTLFVCLVCYFTYVTQSCLQMHITEFHGGLSSAQQSLSFNYNFKN